MNQIYREGAAMAQHGWVMGVTTLTFIACFVGWTWWAFSSANRANMDAAARLPLTVEDDA